MNDRDMYYNGAYGGFTPLNNIPNSMGMNPMLNNQFPNQNMSSYSPDMQTMPTNTYANSWFNDMNERINRLERQVKRLDQRLTRIETPYANTNNFNQEPDNNMYMM